MARKVKMYTSYYASQKIKNQNLQLVQISVSLPKDMHYRKDIWNFDEAKPDWDTVDKIKKGIYTEGDYYAEYMRKLFNNKPIIAKKLVDFYRQANGKDIVFLCYEAPNKFCHRHIFAEFCNKLFTNLDIQEL